MSTIDTVHTDKQRLEKLELLISHCKFLGNELKAAGRGQLPAGPGEVYKVLKLFRLNGDTLLEFANESEACLKALVISEFIRTVELPEPPKDEKHITVPRVLWDSLRSELQALRELSGVTLGVHEGF